MTDVREDLFDLSAVGPGSSAGARGQQLTVDWGVDWAAAQNAVSAAAPRVVSLLRSVRNPEAPALGAWNVRQLAVHLSHSFDGITAMAKGGGGILADLGGLSTLTNALVEGEEEQDLGRLADRITATAGTLLDVMRASPADELRAWLVRGTEMHLSSLTCHALNELIVHGRDIAVADGQDWPVPKSDAALVVSGFLFPALAVLGSGMVNQEGAKDVRASFDVQVRRGGRAVLRFDDGDLTVTPGKPDGPVDCHLSVDPLAFLLVAWNRISQWKAIPRGQLMAYGRKPWLGLKLRTLLNNP